MAPLSASSANSLSSRQHSRDALEAAVGVDAAGGGELEITELAAHARVIVGRAAELGDGSDDARVLRCCTVSVHPSSKAMSRVWSCKNLRRRPECCQPRGMRSGA